MTRTDIDTASAYNTYVIDGLPPGPIANPGRAALEAVANPSRTQDLYFVADGTGGHVFSDSLDSHNRNVQHWRQIEQTNKAKAPAGAPQAARRVRSSAVPPAARCASPRQPYRQRRAAPILRLCAHGAGILRPP